MKEHVFRYCNWYIVSFNAPAHALPYKRVRVLKLASLHTLENFFLEIPLYFCSIPEVFGEGVVWGNPDRL